MKKLPNIAGILYLFVTFCFAPLANQAQGIPADREAAIDAIFKAFDAPDVPGAAVAVWQDGKIAFSKGYGSANLEYGIPVSPSETIFHVASVSKQFTVYAILLLQAEGKLNFDDPIRKYVPEVPAFGPVITLRHLASHTSGMRDQWDLLSLAGWRFDDVITVDHILKLVSRQQDLNFQPGERYTYCNTGFTLLAETVARVSGKSFAEFTKERIFGPVGMAHTLFYDDHEKLVPNRAYSYNLVDGTFKKAVLSFANAGATSLFTTPEDLVRWAHFLNRPPDEATRKVVEQMNTLAVLNNGETFGGAYGQFVNDYKGLTQIQHGGADAGYRSFLGRFPEQDFAVAVVSNFGDSNPNGLAMQVVDLFLADQLTEPEAPEVPEEAPAITLGEDALKAFEGYYWFDQQKTYRQIVLKDGELIYSRPGGADTRLAPIGPSSFKMLDIGVYAVVEFHNENGQPYFVFNGPGGEQTRMDAFEYSAPDAATLGEYAGTYYSPELDTAYEIVLDGDSLIARHNRHADEAITYTRKDELSIGGVGAQITRDDNGKVSGMLVTTGRVVDLKFVRK